MVELVGQGTREVAEGNEIKDILVPVQLTLDFDRGAVVMPVDSLAVFADRYSRARRANLRSNAVASQAYG